MALSETVLGEIESCLAALGSGGNLTAEFRQRFPGISLTRCDASDMSGEEPYRRCPGFDLYLVDGRDHCWHITADAAVATGVVVANRPVARAG
jgi:hypothetical protein